MEIDSRRQGLSRSSTQGCVDGSMVVESQLVVARPPFSGFRWLATLPHVIRKTELQTLNHRPCCQAFKASIVTANVTSSHSVAFSDELEGESDCFLNETGQKQTMLGLHVTVVHLRLIVVIP